MSNQVRHEQVCNPLVLPVLVLGMTEQLLLLVCDLQFLA
jgi:hypothetical protein